MKALLFDFSGVLLLPQDQLNQELLAYLQPLKATLKLYIFTAGVIIERHPDLQAHLQDFSAIYSAKTLGLAKSDPAAYTWLAADLHLSPADILFIDDSSANLAAAHQASLQTHLYKSNEAVMRKIGEEWTKKDE